MTQRVRLCGVAQTQTHFLTALPRSYLLSINSHLCSLGDVALERKLAVPLEELAIPARARLQ